MSGNRPSSAKLRTTADAAPRGSSKPRLSANSADATVRGSASPRTDAKRRGDPQFAHFRIDDSPFYVIARTNGRYVLDMEGSLKKIGMDLPRWRTLMLLNEQSPSTISEIADRAVMRLPTVTKLAQRMEKEGFVELKPNEQDKRVTDMFITAKGRAGVVQVREVASRIYGVGFKDFSAQEIAALMTLLQRLYRNLKMAT